MKMNILIILITFNLISFCFNEDSNHININKLYNESIKSIPIQLGMMFENKLFSKEGCVFFRIRNFSLVDLTDLKVDENLTLCKSGGRNNSVYNEEKISPDFEFVHDIIKMRINNKNYTLLCNNLENSKEEIIITDEKICGYNMTTDYFLVRHNHFVCLLITITATVVTLWGFFYPKYSISISLMFFLFDSFQGFLELLEISISIGDWINGLYYLLIIIIIIIGIFVGLRIIKFRLIVKAYCGVLVGYCGFKFLCFLFLFRLIGDSRLKCFLIQVAVMGLVGLLFSFFIQKMFIIFIIFTSIVGSSYLIKGITLIIGGFPMEMVIIKIAMRGGLSEMKRILNERKFYFAYMILWFVIMVFSMIKQFLNRRYVENEMKNDINNINQIELVDEEKAQKKEEEMETYEPKE